MVVQSQFIEQFSDERWPLKSISELCDIVTDGEHQTPRRVDSGIYLLSARNVKNQELSFDEVDYIDEQEYQRIAKRIEPQENDVLISCSGSVGRTCVVPKGIRFQLVRSVALLRFKPVVDPLFMSYQMAMPYVQSQIETLKSQTSQANLFQGNIKKIQVIVPSKEEQKQFIIVVRQADKSKFDGLKSQFIEMFGDPIENTKRWEQKRLNDLGTLDRGVSRARPRNSPDLLGGPYPLVQTGEVANCETYIKEYLSTYSEKGLAQSKMWPEGTLCITIAANIAKTGILTFEACFPDSVVGFIPNDEVNLLFVHHWFKAVQHHLEELAPSTAQKNMNLGVLSNLKVISPPRVHQDRFASVVKQADKSKYLS